MEAVIQRYDYESTWLLERMWGDPIKKGESIIISFADLRKLDSDEVPEWRLDFERFLGQLNAIRAVLSTECEESSGDMEIEYRRVPNNMVASMEGRPSWEFRERMGSQLSESEPVVAEQTAIQPPWKHEADDWFDDGEMCETSVWGFIDVLPEEQDEVEQALNNHRNLSFKYLNTKFYRFLKGPGGGILSFADVMYLSPPAWAEWLYEMEQYIINVTRFGLASVWMECPKKEVAYKFQYWNSSDDTGTLVNKKVVLERQTEKLIPSESGWRPLWWS